MNQIFFETLNEMPYIFSSNQFAKVAVSKGLPKTLVANGDIGSFLKNKCHRGNSKRMWVKKNNNIPKNETFSAEIIAKENTSISLIEAIAILKANGYQVLKPITKWEQI